jgi:hypothetical protein
MNEPLDPSTTARLIGPLLSDWHLTAIDEEEHPEVRWYAEVVYDHDWTYHVLVRQWRRNDEGTFNFDGHSLWYIGEECAMFVAEWPNSAIAPLISAAAHVMSWAELAQEVNQ